MPICVLSIRFLTSCFFCVITFTISSFVFWSDIKSLIPTLNALDFIYSVITFCKSSINFAEAILPKSLQTRCNRPFVLAPNTLLSICPRIYFPFRISSIAFDVLGSSLSSLYAFVLYFIDNGGII